jgi:hypothetical protein
VIANNKKPRKSIAYIKPSKTTTFFLGKRKVIKN